VAECSIVIPVYNRAELTRQCLDVLLREPPTRTTAEIVVVDDGSTEPQHSIVEAYGDRVSFVRHERNMGFAAACNDGAAASSGRWLVFLNNDTFPQVGWLDSLVHYAEEHPRAAAVGSKLVFPNDTIQHAGVVICQDLYPRHVYAGFPADHPAVNRSRAFQSVTAACVLICRNAFVEAGGFDTAFRNGYEDVDLCLRLGERGYEIHYCHSSVVYHLESVSRDDRRGEVDAANDQLFRDRWADRLRPDDVSYYIADGLLRFKYWELYPAALELSALLATVVDEDHDRQADRLLAVRTRQVFELLKENTRLKLGVDAPLFRAGVVDGSQPAGTNPSESSP
jgi:GT2 family glycosyltransferase